MSEAALLLTVVSVVAVGVGSYLYNDGYSHARVGLISAGAGWAACLLGGALSSQQVAEEQSSCVVGGRESYCTVQDLGLWTYVWERLLEPMVLEAVLTGAAGLLGLAIARGTARQPPDGRASLGLPPDD